MAGSYPDAPYRRMAWDEDGTVFWNARSVAQYTATVLPGYEFVQAHKIWANNEGTITPSDSVTMSGETGTGSAGYNKCFFMIFPELRDVYGMNWWAIAVDSSSTMNPSYIQSSVDTTNGIDGTWVDIFGTTTYPGSTPYSVYSWDHWYRIGIVSSSPFPRTGVRGLRFTQIHPGGLIAKGYWMHLHVYGDKATGATPDRLLFIDDLTGLEFTGPLDWGDVPRGTTLTHDIQIYNNSATLTANDIELDFEALTGISDTWHTLSDSGGGFSDILTIASIAPASYYPASNVITIKLTVADNENLGPNSSRLQALTETWT